MSAVIKFPGPSAPHNPPQKEARVVADLDDGFTRVANELLDALMRTKMSGTQSQVVMAVIRQTYGYRKAKDRVHTGYLAELTGLHSNRIKDAVVELEKRNILKIERGSGIFFMVAVNKVISEWISDKVESRDAARKSVKASRKSVNKITEIRDSNHGNPSTTKENYKRKEQIKISSSQIADALPDARGDESVSPPAEKIRPDAAIQTPSGKFWGTQDDLTAAEFIHGKVLVVNPTAKAPNWAQWANDIRLMRTQLGYTHREICSLFRWANLDPFWSANVLCPKTLRKQWDKLTAKRAGVVRQPVRGDEWDLTKTMTADKLNQLIQEGY